MKSFKILFTFAFVLCFGMSYGQLTVDADNEVGIGTATPSKTLEVNVASNPTLRLTENSADSYFDLSQQSDDYAVLNKRNGAAGAALIDINPIPSDGAGKARFRFFRSTNTTGQAIFDIYRGNGTAELNCQIAGNDNSFFNALVGNVGIGTQLATEKLTVNGNVQADNVMFQDPNFPERYITITDVVAEQNSAVEALKEDIEQMIEVLEALSVENTELRNKITELENN